jgi:PAS domain-containing protein
MTPTVELVLQRVHPEDAALVQQTIERAEQDGKDFDHEYRLVMPDSFLKYVHVVAHALKDESAGIEFVGAVMDVTAAKQAEKTLKESAAYLAEAQRLMHTGSAAWQVAGRSAVNLSEEWYRIYGFDPKEGPSAWEKRLQRMHPEDRAKWGEITDRAIREKADYEGERTLTTILFRSWPSWTQAAGRGDQSRGASAAPLAGHLRGHRSQFEHGDQHTEAGIGRFRRKTPFCGDAIPPWLPIHRPDRKGYPRHSCPLCG